MKNKKALYTLLTANAISQFAQGISMLAIPWYFAKQLGEASFFATFYAIATFATLFWGLYAGTLIDKFPRKNIFLGLCAVSFTVLALVSGYGFFAGAVPMTLVALVFCFTIFNYNIHYPTLYAFGQEITEKENYGKTNSLLEVIGQTTNVLSGAMAIVLIEGLDIHVLDYHLQIEAWSIQKIFALDASTYLVAMALIKSIKYIPTVEKVAVSKENAWVRLKEGVQFLKSNPLIFHFGNASYTVFIFVLITTHLLWPMYIDQHLQVEGDIYASTKVLYALGAVISGFFITKLLKLMNTVVAVILLMTIATVAFTLLSVSQNVMVLLGLGIFFGVSNAGVRILRVTYLFNHIPNHVIGRSNSVFQSINIFLRSAFIGLFSFDFFSEGSNIIWAFVIAAAATLLSIVPLVVYYKRLVGREKLTSN
ncbi:MFS transporter [Vicingaceae bacterium]|nr:MFS transporter [Vicingaceae bacterium]